MCVNSKNSMTELRTAQHFRNRKTHTPTLRTNVRTEFTHRLQRPFLAPPHINHESPFCEHTFVIHALQWLNVAQPFSCTTCLICSAIGRVSVCNTRITLTPPHESFTVVFLHILYFTPLLPHHYPLQLPCKSASTPNRSAATPAHSHTNF